MLPGNILVREENLYSEDMIKLDDETISKLSSYGFDTDYYFELRKKSDVGRVLITGGLVVAAAGYLLSEIGVDIIMCCSVGLAGASVAVAGEYVKFKSDKRIAAMVGEFNEHIMFGVSNYGYGIIYSF